MKSRGHSEGRLRLGIASPQVRARGAVRRLSAEPSRLRWRWLQFVCAVRDKTGHRNGAYSSCYYFKYSWICVFFTAKMNAEHFTSSQPFHLKLILKLILMFLTCFSPIMVSHTCYTCYLPNHANGTKCRDVAIGMLSHLGSRGRKFQPTDRLPSLTF